MPTYIPRPEELGRTDELKFVAPRELHCMITGCTNEPENTVRIIRNDHSQYAYKCRAHTSKYDTLVLGPGPLENQ